MTVNSKNFINSNSINTKSKKIDYLTLENLSKGDSAYIDIVPENLLLAPLGIRSGKIAKLEAKQPFKGPIVISIEGRKVAISRHIANKISVSIGDKN
jgi:Fe2+ transport system protein FeoA